MTCFRDGHEPRLEEIMSDPIVKLLMRRDRISDDDVNAAVRRARHGLKVRALSPDGAGPQAL